MVPSFSDSACSPGESNKSRMAEDRARANRPAAVFPAYRAAMRTLITPS